MIIAFASMSYLQWNVTWPEPSTLNTSGVQSCPAAMMEVGDTHMQLWRVNAAYTITVITY